MNSALSPAKWGVDLTVAACIWWSPRYGARDAFRPVLHAGGLSARKDLGVDLARLGDDRRIRPATGYGIVHRAQRRPVRGIFRTHAGQPQEWLGVDAVDAFGAA